LSKPRDYCLKNEGEEMKTYTASGKPFDVMNSDGDEIKIEDIAHSLSMQCCWQGATPVFYSKAERSLMVAKLVYEKDILLAGSALLCYSSDAYMGGVSIDVRKATYHPSHPHLVGIDGIETRLLKRIYEALGVDISNVQNWKTVIRATEKIRAYEEDMFFRCKPEQCLPKLYNVRSQVEAKEDFLKAAKRFGVIKGD